ncbi:MAG: hypothetical protein RLZZ618_2590 [Pseudomonadota bacterium]|jgi:general secretion pathway protein J
MPSRGFTLVEVLVAMSIMATVSIMSWRGVDGIMRTRDASQQKLDQLLRINAVLGQWEQDLNALQPTAALKQNPTFDGARLTLTRRSPNGVQLVVWSLKNNVWFRWAGPPVTTTRALEDQWVSSKQFIGNEPGQLRALIGVSQWQVYYNRDKTWSNAQSTGDAPDVPDSPDGVRLLLSFSGEQGTMGNITRDISLKK